MRAFLRKLPFADLCLSIEQGGQCLQADLCLSSGSDHLTSDLLDCRSASYHAGKLSTAATLILWATSSENIANVLAP